MNLPIGRQLFINSGAMFTDLGGITLEERVLTGPHATIISVNHPLDPAERRGATILPGVSVGGNTVVVAGTVVREDVPSDTVVAGIPARILKTC